MIHFRFTSILFWLLPLGILVVASVLMRKKKGSFWSRMNPDLRENLFQRLHWGRFRWQQRLGIWGLFLLTFAASGPQIGTRVAPVERKGVDLVIALDVSLSMEAEDVKPNRLDKAKFEIAQLIRHLKGDRVGLVVFAGTSNLYLPLTTDYEAAYLFLDAIDTKMIPTQGTDLSAAIRTTLTTFKKESDHSHVMVLITDGEDHEGGALEAAREAAEQRVIIHTVGVGTVTGSLIPILDDMGKGNEYKRDRKGKLVTSVLNEEILREIAQVGHGIFTRFDNRLANYKEILKAVDKMDKQTIQTHVYSQFEDRYQGFAALALLCFLASMFLPTHSPRDDTWRGRIV